MASINNKKGYDMIPQTKVIKCLKMNKILHINLISKAMENWKVELAVGQNLAVVEALPT